MNSIQIEPGIQFGDIKEFTRYLEYERINNHLPGVLNLVATISTFETINQFIESLESAGFVIEEQYGKLLSISKRSKNDKISYYAFFDDYNNIPLFLTDANKTDEIPKTLFNYINKTRNISNMWISPQVMKEIKDDLSIKYEDMIITYFSAQRGANTEARSELRPHYERNVQYHGNDGKQTLEEMEYWYGVLPRILEIKLPTVAFKIDNKGIITLRSGRFGEIFSIIENVVGQLLELRDAIGKSSYSIRHIGKRHQFAHAIQRPWSIEMPVGLDIDEVPRFCNTLQNEDFTILERVLLHGSMQFTARIIDDYTGSLFDIKTSGRKIDVFPVKQPDIGSSMRFYQFICENIDNAAQVG
ncbi:hypothetical protein FGU65_13830 [Methanoculleus sp. FWC-SCC1]|uniref:Uncharacterized protein n=1 Tax=Methanoculleus frigidifontis TaxID=2584085 RepID=A0ABT8MDC1_9EURY|nr:hypothetical protein [Methanoculleus sp. FWC-SCC1]MDN7025950.1 hypothetical protein [Methanoculleus sp. FWC-SCC1]